MQINAASSNSQTAAAQTATNAPLDTTFLQLLTAQLQNQDPTSPMDPNQFLGQLVQLNSLEQLIGIRQLLTQGGK
jgi:flagellar basal-body rod modification protein FlgD